MIRAPPEGTFAPVPAVETTDEREARREREQMQGWLRACTTEPCSSRLTDATGWGWAAWRCPSGPLRASRGRHAALCASGHSH